MRLSAPDRMQMGEVFRRVLGLGLAGAATAAGVALAAILVLSLVGIGLRVGIEVDKVEPLGARRRRTRFGLVSRLRFFRKPKDWGFLLRRGGAEDARTMSTLPAAMVCLPTGVVWARSSSSCCKGSRPAP